MVGHSYSYDGTLLELFLFVLDLDKHETIDQIDCITILKDLNKEVKTAEKISLKINPPKPERESNRRRKKKSLDDDFITTIIEHLCFYSSNQLT